MLVFGGVDVAPGAKINPDLLLLEEHQIHHGDTRDYKQEHENRDGVIT